MHKKPPSPAPGKTRRVIRRRKNIPALSDLVSEANERGMTVKEYVEWLNSMNRDKSKSRAEGGRRNNSSTYDLGPIPFRKDKAGD